MALKFPGWSLWIACTSRLHDYLSATFTLHVDVLQCSVVSSLFVASVRRIIPYPRLTSLTRGRVLFSIRMILLDIYPTTPATYSSSSTGAVIIHHKLQHLVQSRQCEQNREISFQSTQNQQHHNYRIFNTQTAEVVPVCPQRLCKYLSFAFDCALATNCLWLHYTAYRSSSFTEFQWNSRAFLPLSFLECTPHPTVPSYSRFVLIGTNPVYLEPLYKTENELSYLSKQCHYLPTQEVV